MTATRFRENSRVIRHVSPLAQYDAFTLLTPDNCLMRLTHYMRNGCHNVHIVPTFTINVTLISEPNHMLERKHARNPYMV